MATIKLTLDTRTQNKDKTYPIRLYVYTNGKVSFINLNAYLSEKEYKEIFEKTPTGKRLEYRRSFEVFVNKAIDIHKNMKKFDLVEFKKLLFAKPEKKEKETTSLKGLFEIYKNARQAKLSLKTLIMYNSTLNCILRFKPDAKLEDVTIQFLEEFEIWYNDAHNTKSNSSVSIHLRNLRAVVNMVKDNEALPIGYRYPFGKGRYSIKNIVKPKQTFTEDEIKTIVKLDQFKSSEEMKARDLWLMQYYCNGVNLNDLVRLRWDNLVGNCFVIQRQKTKNTTSSRPVFIRIPLVDNLKALIEKVGNKNSPYVLGFLREHMSETQIHEKKRKVAKMMNANLKVIGKRLNLSIEFLSETSRDAYATTLKKNGRSIEEIAEMLGHSSITCTRNYLAQFEETQIHSINQGLF
jgi:integrase